MSQDDDHEQALEVAAATVHIDHTIEVRRARDFARTAITAYLSALPQRELLAEALAYAHQLEQCVAEFLDAYTAFNNDELDEVSMNDAEHGMKLAMYAFREARAAADKIRASLTQEKQT